MNALMHRFPPFPSPLQAIGPVFVDTRERIWYVARLQTTCPSDPRGYRIFREDFCFHRLHPCKKHRLSTPDGYRGMSFQRKIRALRPMYGGCRAYDFGSEALDHLELLAGILGLVRISAN